MFLIAIANATQTKKQIIPEMNYCVYYETVQCALGITRVVPDPAFLIIGEHYFFDLTCSFSHASGVIDL